MGRSFSVFRLQTSRLRDATSQRDALNEELEYCRDENRGLEGMVKGYEEQVQASDLVVSVTARGIRR